MYFYLLKILLHTLLLLVFEIVENLQCILKRQPHKMVNHTQTIRRLLLTNCLNVFDHFVVLALKRLHGLLAVH